MVTIADFGGWDKVQAKHFNDGGLFDKIYAKKYEGTLTFQRFKGGVPYGFRR